MTFMKDAAKLYGTHLEKLVVDTIVKSTIARQSTSFTMGGRFMEIADAEDLYKNKPEIWNNIKDRAPRFRCNIRGTDMIQVPTYESESKKENIDSEEKKRKVEAEEIIKKAKKIKTPKHEAIIAVIFLFVVLLEGVVSGTSFIRSASRFCAVSWEMSRSLAGVPYFTGTHVSSGPIKMILSPTAMCA